MQPVRLFFRKKKDNCYDGMHVAGLSTADATITKCKNKPLLDELDVDSPRISRSMEMENKIRAEAEPNRSKLTEFHSVGLQNPLISLVVFSA